MKRSEKFRDKKKSNDEIRRNPGKERIFLAVIDIESEKKKNIIKIRYLKLVGQVESDYKKGNNS